MWWLYTQSSQQAFMYDSNYGFDHHDTKPKTSTHKATKYLINTDHATIVIN